jgi:transcriptional regulator with XRE-family HTH domain
MNAQGAQIQQAVGALIQAKRKAIGMSQETLSAAIGLSRSSIANIECGRQKIGVPLLYQIADLLQTTPHDLLPPLPSKPASKAGTGDAALPPGLPRGDQAWIRSVLNSTKKRA